MMLSFPQLVAALPEIIMAIGSLFVLVYGVLKKRDASMIITHVVLGILLGVLILELLSTTNKQIGFGNLYISDYFSVFAKIMILLSAFLVLFITRESVFREGIAQFEYPVLILLSVLGMMIMVSSYDLITLFVGLELQSLSLYVLTALRRDHAKASESGLKYFILGALSTGLLLYGISLFYGFTGTTHFSQLAKMLSGTTNFPLGIYVAAILVSAGVVFKISVVPFHMWTPDVYEGAPTSVTTFLATTAKVAAFLMIVRLFSGPLHGLMTVHLSDMLVAISIASMILGVFGALFQTNIKRLIAYSSIANMGYLMIGLIVGTSESIQSSLFFLVIYVATLLGFFICILNLSRRGRDIESVKDLSGLALVNPGTTFAMGFFLFSLAGIPPLAGFLGKLYIFQAAVTGGYINLAIVGVLTSVVAAGYYLWIIKVMAMDALIPGQLALETGYRRDQGVTVVLSGLVLALTVLFIKPNLIVSVATNAASSLFFVK